MASGTSSGSIAQYHRASQLVCYTHEARRVLSFEHDEDTRGLAMAAWLLNCNNAVFIFSRSVECTTRGVRWRRQYVDSDERSSGDTLTIIVYWRTSRLHALANPVVSS